LVIAADKQIKFKQFIENLLTGEKVLWIGQPKKCSLYRGWDFVAIPIWGWVIPFAVALIYAGVKELTNDFRIDTFEDTWLPILLGIFLLPIGFYGAFWRYAIKKRKINSTFYAATDKRLLMFSIISGKSEELHFNSLPVELNLDSVKDIGLQINRDDTGTLIFYDGKRFLPPKGKERVVNDLPEDGREPWGYPDKVFAFLDIREARQAYDLIKGIQTVEIL
jgi:hypothetical protein